MLNNWITEYFLVERHNNLCKNVWTIEQVWKIVVEIFEFTFFFIMMQRTRFAGMADAVTTAIGPLRWSAYSALWISNWLLLFSSAHHSTSSTSFSHLPLCALLLNMQILHFVYMFGYGTHTILGMSNLKLWTECFPNETKQNEKKN